MFYYMMFQHLGYFSQWYFFKCCGILCKCIVLRG